MFCTAATAVPRAGEGGQHKHRASGRRALTGEGANGRRANGVRGQEAEQP